MRNRQELRLALSMRGGCSLAVWIGGAVSEIARLRTTLDDGPDGHPWGALARLAGYDSARVDVLTGASAGGLNGALMAASLVYGYRFDSIRELWVRLGDIEAMCRPTPTVRHARPVSLLEGDDYFGAELAKALTELVSGAQTTTPADRVDLVLTATLLNAVTVLRRDDRLGAMMERRRGASFHFKHRGRAGDPLTDFAAGPDAATTAAQLATAARTTSSFPFAFEPAGIWSQPDPPAGSVDMCGRFSELAPGGTKKPFQVIDGGVLDNIPVAAAIRAIAAAPADGPTDRWLLYLNPDPYIGSTGPTGQSRLQRALPTGLAALAARAGQESLLTDIDELEEHNREAARTELRRRALFAPLAATPRQHRAKLLADTVDQVRAEHAGLRARLAAQACADLLEDPSGHGFGPLRAPSVPHDPIAGWAPELRRALPARLAVRFTAQAQAAPERVFADVSALAGAVDLGISWARELERWAPSRSLAPIGAVKAGLYRLRQVVEVFTGHADGRWLAAAASLPSTGPTELDAWIDATNTDCRQAQHEVGGSVLAALTAVLSAALDPEAQTPADQQFQQRLVELCAVLETAGSGGPDPVDAVALGWECVYTLVDRLAAAAPRRPLDGEPMGEELDPSRTPDLVGHQLLEDAEDADRAIVLRQLIVLTAPLGVARTEGGRIRFLRVASDAKTSLDFGSLRREDQPLTPDDKLCGNDLGAFAAFCSAKWRANDWMWGRLDAAASLVALLTDPARLRSFNSDASTLCAEIGRIATSPLDPAEFGGPAAQAPADAQAWHGFLVRRWETRRDAVSVELIAALADPATEHPLSETRAALTERFHWGIAAAEIPFVTAVGLGSQPGEPVRPEPMPPAVVAGQLKRYQIGHHTLADLGDVRLARMAMRLGLLAYRAVKPLGRTVPAFAARSLMTLLKPVLMAALLVFSAAERTMLAAAVGVAGLACAGWHGGWIGAPWPVSVVEPDWDVARVGVTVLAVLLAGLALRTAVRGFRRKTPLDGVRRPAGLALLAVLVLGAGLAAMAMGVTLAPLAIGLVAVGVAWLGTFWMRPVMRVVAGIVTAVLAVATALLFADLGWSVGWWIVVAGLLPVYTLATLASVVDVLPDRRP